MHAGHKDVRMAAQAALQAALVLGLELVVELVGDQLAHLGQERAASTPGREALQDRAHEAEVAQVGLDRLGHAGVLDLDGDLRPVVRARAVDLAEGRERERLLVEVAEQLADGRVELVLDDPAHAIEGDRRRARGQGAEGALGALALEGEHREQLHELRARALHPPELGTELLGQREGLRVPARRRSLTLRPHDGLGPSRSSRRARARRCAGASPSAPRRPATARWCR